MNTAQAAPLQQEAASDTGQVPVSNLYGDYFDQIFQVPPTICGCQLKCLSIGRYRMMARFRAAFVSDEERIATPGDLLISVLICSMSVEDFVQFASQPDFRKQMMKWGSKWGFFPPKCFSWPIIGKWLERFFGTHTAESDFEGIAKEINAFKQYIFDGSKSPDYWDESPSNKTSAAHWSQNIEVVLRGNLNWTQEEINEEPLGKALWDYFKFMENNGLVTLLTPEQAKENNTPLTKEEANQSEMSAKKALEYLKGLGVANAQ